MILGILITNVSPVIMEIIIVILVCCLIFQSLNFKKKLKSIKKEFELQVKISTTEQIEKWKIENERKIRNEYLSSTALMRRLSKQLIIDLKDERNYEKLILSIMPQNNADRNTMIEKIALLIEEAGILADDGYTVQNAIEKKLNDENIIFKSDLDKDIFINSLSKIILDE
jgi:hypothetical protein